MRLWRFILNTCRLNEASFRNISFDAVIPIFMIPILLFIAAQELVYTVMVFLMTPLLVYYLYRNFLRFLMHTKFFFVWTITSVVTLMLIFELSVVPQLEILPEENLVFIICVVGGLVCGYETRLKSDRTKQESLMDELEFGESDGNVCNICNKQALPKAVHCRLCHTCILEREYHCKWLDCCIGRNNLRWYLMFLFFSTAAFLYGSNLTMTTICHPFVFVATILLPDDCSDAYFQLDLAACFVASIYSLLIGTMTFFYLIYHVWLLITKNLKGKYLHTGENLHNEGIFKSTIQFFSCRS